MEFINLVFMHQPIDSFEHPWAFAGLLVIPLGVFAVMRLTKRYLRRVMLPDAGEPSECRCRRVLHADWRVLVRSLSFWAFCVSALLLTLSIVFLTVALAKPYGGATQETRTEGIEIYFVVDMSASMKAYDYSVSEMREREIMDEYTPNRYNVARNTILGFVRSRAERCSLNSGMVSRCDRIGVAMFGQYAFIDIPMTTDYALIERHLRKRRINDIDATQSAIGDGIMSAVASLRHSHAKSKNIILVSDGDQKGGRVSVSQAIAAARMYDVKIFPVVIGASDRAVLAEVNAAGGYSYFEAEFPVNEKLLEEIARQTGGVAYRVSRDEEFMGKMMAILEKLEPQVTVENRRNHQLDLSLHYVALGFLFALMAVGIYVTAVRHYP